MKEVIKSFTDVLPCIIPLILIGFGLFVYYFKGGENEGQ